jgi:hypothetical protein
MPLAPDHLFLCTYHARREARAAASQKAGSDIAYSLSTRYISHNDVAVALAQTISGTAQRHISSRTASSIALLSRHLLQAIAGAEREYIETYGQDGWTDRIAHNRLTLRPRPKSASAPDQVPPAETFRDLASEYRYFIPDADQDADLNEDQNEDQNDHLDQSRNKGREQNEAAPSPSQDARSISRGNSDACSQVAAAAFYAEDGLAHPTEEPPSLGQGAPAEHPDPTDADPTDDHNEAPLDYSGYTSYWETGLPPAPRTPDNPGRKPS